MTRSDPIVEAATVRLERPAGSDTPPGHVPVPNSSRAASRWGAILDHGRGEDLRSHQAGP